MTWDDTKSNFESRPDIPAEEKLSADEYNALVDAVKDRGYASVTTVTADYSADPQEIVLVDASGGAVTVMLPDPVEAEAVLVKVTDAANTVTVATPGSETIDGGTDLTITTQYEAREIVSDGTDYYIISGHL